MAAGLDEVCGDEGEKSWALGRWCFDGKCMGWRVGGIGFGA